MPSPSATSTIRFAKHPVGYCLTEANYSTGDYYHYTLRHAQGGAYDPVGNRLTETTQLAVTSYQYDIANRLTSVDSVSYTWDNNGNASTSSARRLLNDGVNSYSYNTSNQLTAMSGPFGSSTFAYNGLGDRLTQNGVNYTLDLNAGLTQVLSDGTNTYLYGLGRIAQVNTTTLVTDYFITDALGSVRQLTDAQGAVTLANAYEPYGTLAQSAGSAQTSYGFTGEYTDPSGMVYLRARYYMPNDGRFLTRDTWMGDYNSPLSLNRWLYVEGNPVNRADPSGQCYVDTGNLPKWRPWEWEWKVWEYPIVGPCRDHSGPISPDEPHWHEYWSANLVCSAWLNCSREEVVDALSRFTFPGQNPFKPVQPDQQSFVAPFSWFPGIELNGMPVEYLGAIQSSIFSDGLHVRNVSEPTHIFHKGQVDREAKQVGKAWFVVTHGTGNNIYFAMDVVNQETGAGIFTGVDMVMRQYLEATHILNWIKGLDC